MYDANHAIWFINRSGNSIMKRYTATFQSIELKVYPKDIGEELERVLLRLHPRITYKIGQVAPGVDGRMYAHIAVDGKRELLETALKTAQWKLPISFEGLTWGWMVDNEEVALLMESTSPLDTDPLAQVEAQAGTREFILNKKRFTFRYILLVLSTVVMLLLLIANGIRTHVPALEAVYLVFFAIWLFSLNETPFDYRVYTQKIVCDMDRLQVFYWLPRRVVSLEWTKITGMEYTEPVCTLLHDAGKLRFLVSERFGCREKPTVLKTIVDRSGLHYVEGNLTRLEYRR